MKIRTMPALLLSLLVVAGVAATDAYAQSNTERIQDVHRDTNIIRDVVEAIQSAITALGEKVDQLISSMASVDEKVTNLETSASSTSSSISSIQTTLDEISMNVQTMAASDGNGETASTTIALNDLINGMSRINARINDLADTLTNVEARLVNIEVGLVGVETKVSTPPPTTTTTPARGSLTDSTVQKDVTAYNFKQSGQKKSDRNSFDYYDLDLTFSCNNDVFIDNVRMIQRIGADDQYLDRAAVYTDGSEAPPDGNFENINYVKVNGRDLYHNWFVSSGNNHIEYNPPSQDFDNMPLRSNQALSFETRVYDGNFTTADGAKTYQSPTTTIPQDNTMRLIEHAPKPTRDNDDTNEPLELYTLEVTYRTYYLNTSCSLGFGKAGSSGISVDTSSTLHISADVEESDSILKDFENIIDCGGNPVEITGVTTATVDEWNNSISSFAKMYFTVEDGVNDDDPDATFTFDSNGRAELSEGDYPSFGNSDLRIHGKLPAAEGLLISIEYLSVSANVCEDKRSSS